MGRRGRKLYGKLISMGRARGLEGKPHKVIVRNFFNDIRKGVDVPKALKKAVDDWEAFEKGDLILMWQEDIKNNEE